MGDISVCVCFPSSFFFFFGALTTLTLPPPSSPPSSLLIRSLGCDVDVGPVSSSLMEPLCLPLSPPPQLERVNNSQASYYKDKALFFFLPPPLTQ